MNTLHDLLIKDLQLLYTAEVATTEALPKLISAATTEELKDSFAEHLEQTRTHVSRLEECAQNLDFELTSPSNEVVKALLSQGEKLIKAYPPSAVLDAALIGAAQKVEHYEIACYGTAIAWAKEMDHDDVVDLLVDTLEEEKSTDEKLTDLAEGGIISDGINEQASEADNDNV